MNTGVTEVLTNRVLPRSRGGIKQTHSAGITQEREFWTLIASRASVNFASNLASTSGNRMRTVNIVLCCVLCVVCCATLKRFNFVKKWVCERGAKLHNISNDRINTHR